MFRFIAETFLKTRIAKDNSTRKKQFLPWDKVEKIAIILDKKDNINKSEIDKFIEGTKKFIDVFYIELSSNQASYGDWQCFSKKDKSLLNLPKGTIHTEIKRKKFDVIINTSGDTELFASAITSGLSAPLKCGCSDKYNDVDLIIKKTEPYSIIAHLNNVFMYLKMIRV